MEVLSFCFLAVLSLCSLLLTEDNLHLCNISMILDLNIYLFYLTKKDETPEVSVCAVYIAATHHTSHEGHHPARLSGPSEGSPD